MKKVKLYYNNIFNDGRINGSASLGAADPFIFKWNGFYYLTCTRPKGLVLMKSFDLVKWKNVNDDGIVGLDQYLYHAYAPEITYFDGNFYMVCSPSGNGHHIYRSPSLLGPFVHYKGNFEELIDGSFFLDSDEKTYFLRASETGITIKKFKENNHKSEFDLFDEYYNFKDTIIGNWTEGPFMIKRYGYYYLTYTGTHFLSNAYRVDYASGKELSSTGLKFQDTILLSTTDDFYGLGHSMTFLGPNLDSYYIAYHNMMDNHKRYLNISRLMFDNHGHLICNGSYIKNNPILQRPTFEKFVDEEKYISDYTLSSSFSTEYNFIGEDVILYISYDDGKNYTSLKLHKQSLEVVKIKDGKSQILLNKPLNKTYNLNVFHTIRVQYSHGLISIYLDQMEIVYKVSLKIKRGKIGFNNNILKPSYIASSIYAYGSSDIEVTKNKEFFLDNCIKDKEKYSCKFDIDEDGDYQIFVNGKPSVNDYTLQIDDKKFEQSKYIFIDNTLIANISLQKGIHTFELTIKNGTNKSIKIVKKDKCLSLNEDNFFENSDVYHRYIKLDKGFYLENDRNAIITKNNYQQYTLSANIKIVGNPIKDDTFVGLIAEGHNYSKSNQFENAYSLQGYLFVMNADYIYIIDTNFAHSKVLKKIKSDNVMKGVTLKIIKDLSSISFYINNIKIFSILNSNKYLGGKCGLYNNHASAIFTDYCLNIKKKEEKSE